MDEIPPAQLAILAKEDQGPKVIGLVVAFTAFAFICVILRFFTSIKLRRSLGLEDYFIGISMVGFPVDYLSPLKIILAH